jgi:hypothetical protein
MPRVDDRVAQFLVSVGKLCEDAHLGGFAVRLTLLDDSQLAGVPEPPAETAGAGQLDDTGFADRLTVDGVVVALSDVAEASIQRPALSGDVTNRLDGATLGEANVCKPPQTGRK